MQFSLVPLAISLATSAAIAGPILPRQQDPEASPTSSQASAAATSTGTTPPPAVSTPAAPAALNDTQILQFALTLEHLEAAFYNTSVAKFGDEAFQQAGLNSTARDQIYAIGLDEAAHVSFLESALGNASVAACDYDFSTVTDVNSFLATSQILEAVGTSAYLGAAGLVADKQYLVAAGSILTVEARHASVINAAVAKASGNDSSNAVPLAFDTPLNATQVFSLAAPFIKSCPENSTLPFKPFPAATVTLGSDMASSSNVTNATSDAAVSPGNTFSISYNNTLAQSQDGTNTTNSTNYVAVVSGPTAPLFFPLTGDQKSFTIPSNVTGLVYFIVTSSNSSVTDDNTIAGPAIHYVDAPLPKAPAATADNSTSTNSTEEALPSSSASSSAAPSQTGSADGAMSPAASRITGMASSLLASATNI